MWKLTVKSLFARKLRLTLTSIAIVLGVSFVVSSFVIADSLRSTFDKLVEDIQGNIDLTVRRELAFGSNEFRQPVDADVLPAVLDTDGVRSAQGDVFLQGVVPIKANGDPVKTVGPPIFGVNYYDDPDLTQLLVMEGRAPAAADEFVIDIDTADDDDFVVGETYTVASATTDNRQFTLVGTVAFNDESNPLVGAVLTAYDTATAQDFFGLDGKYSQIIVKVDDGVDVAAVQQRIQERLPDGVEVVDREVTIQEGQDDFGQISAIFGNVLLAFAIITLVVSAFLINNTFQIIIGQRVRELALLRAIGSTGRQVSRSVLMESLVIGGVSTVIGIGGGVLLSFGMRALFDALGFGLPSGPLQLRPRTVIFAIIVGVGVTMAASLAPARKARRVPPMAALREDYQLASTSLRRRLAAGGLVTALGVVLMGWGLFGSLETISLLLILSTGALAVFVGVNLLSPLVARPVARGLGTPVQAAYRTTGRLAKENAARNPRRTSSTAAALMIGLALVSMAAVVGNSLKATFLDILGNAVTADYFIQPDSGGFTFGGLPPAYSEALAEQPEIESVAPYRWVPQGARVEGRTKDISGWAFAVFPSHLDIDVREGSLDNLTDTDLLVHRDSAKDHGLSLGDAVDVEFLDGQTETVTVAAIYGDASIAGNWVIDLELWRRHFHNDEDSFLTARRAAGIDEAAANEAVARVTSTYPQIKAETKAEFEASQQQQLDSFLAVITGFLALALVIALLGIVNTMALSVFERTRELGLLRAVGMTRRQMRRMVRWEAAIVTVFGAVLGVAIGIVFGVAAASAIPPSIVNQVSVPWFTVLIYVMVAAFFGLLFAYFPARRAGKLNVLDAIQHE